MGRPDALDHLLRFSNNEDSSLRGEAYCAMAAVAPLESAVQVVAPALIDENNGIRWEAQRGLRDRARQDSLARDQFSKDLIAELQSSDGIQRQRYVRALHVVNDDGLENLIRRLPLSKANESTPPVGEKRDDEQTSLLVELIRAATVERVPLNLALSISLLNHQDYRVGSRGCRRSGCNKSR